MAKHSFNTEKSTALRKRAEQLLDNSRDPGTPRNPANINALIHELEVYQIELELQNEELCRAQTELETSRDRYADLYDAAPVGYLTLDREGRIHEANLTVATLLVVPRGKLLGSRLSDFVFPDDQDIWYLHRTRVFGGEGPQTVELRLQRPDESTFFAQLESRPESTTDAPQKCRTVLFDISARRRAEDQARASQLHFRQLLEKLPTAAYTCSADGLITYYNKQAAELWGREPKLNDPADRFCRSFKMYLPDGSPLDHDRCGMTLALEEDKEYREQEIIIQRPDGSRRTALAHATPIHDERGKLIGAINVVVDITAAKQAEKALQDAKETLELRVSQRTAELAETLARFESIARHVPDCFWSERIDENGTRHVEYVSPGWQTIWGYTPDEVYADADLWLKSIVAVDLPVVQQALDGAIASNKQSIAIYRIRSKQGDVRWIEDTMTPTEYQNGRVTQLEGIARDITERKQTLDTLREQRRLLEEAQRMAHLGNWEWNPQTNELTWSDELYRIYGLDPEQDEITFERFMEAVHPDDRDVIQQNCQRTLQTGEPFILDERIRRPDGGERILYSCGYAVRDDQGQPLKLCGVCQDVTEQRHEEAKFRDLLEAAPDAMVIVDATGTIKFVNRQFEILFGYNRPELLGRPVEMLVPQSLRSKHVEHRESFLQQPSFRPMGYGLELRGVRKDGKEVPVEISLSPLQTPQGQLVTGAIRDITERKLAKDELQLSQQRLAEAQRIAHIGNWDWDILTGRNWWSEELYRMCHVCPDSFKPSLNALLELVVPEDRQLIRDRVQAIVDRDEPFVAVYRVQIDDSVRFHCCHAQLSRNDAGEPVRLAGIVQDITEQREVQMQLRRTERMASLGTLVAGIAHEINNPMSAAWTAAEAAKAIKEKPDAQEMLDECLDTIGDAVSRSQVIIQNMLRFARQESSEKERCDLNQIVRQALETTLHYANYHGSKIHTELAEGLPQPTVNAPEIEQVLVNLIRNAVKAGEGTSISVSTEQGFQVVRIRVQDNGRGIPSADIDRIFDPFFTTNDQGEGTGLGLAISHGIVEDHEGKIDAASTVGLGSTFVVTLPIIAAFSKGPPHVRRSIMGKGFVD